MLPLRWAAAAAAIVAVLAAALLLRRQGPPPSLYRLRLDVPAIDAALWMVDRYPEYFDGGEGDALAEARAAGLVVIVKEALANGRLTARNVEPAFAATRARLEAEAERLGTTLDGLALAAALARPWADVVLFGAATVEQLRSNLGALDVRWDRDADHALADLAEPSERYWATRKQLPWN